MEDSGRTPTATGFAAQAHTAGSDGSTVSCRGDPRTIPVSVASPAAGGRVRPAEDAAMTPNGRYVAFVTPEALVPGDTNEFFDIFVRDVRRGVTTQVSVSSSGRQSNGDSVNPAISANGRYVAFASLATNLVPGDTNGTWDVFVRDRRTARTTRVSESSTGEQANWPSEYPSISTNGRYVTFSSFASNLVPGDANENNDISLHDRRTGSTTLESRSSTGEQGDYGHTYAPNPTASTNGRYIAFASAATNLVPGDTNDTSDVFVRDRVRGSTARVSVTDAGAQLDTDSGSPSITADGRAVLFDAYGVYLRCAPR
jgi:Tol biopolymer transport system component